MSSNDGGARATAATTGCTRTRSIAGLVLALRRTTIVVRALDQDDEAPVGDPTDPAWRVAPPLQRDKVLGEAALLLRASRTHGHHDDVAPAWDDLAQATAAAYDPTALVSALCISPAGSWDHAFTHLQLRALGLVGGDLDPLLAAALPAASDPGRELLPSFRLERHWLASIWDGDSSPRADPSTSTDASTTDPGDLAGTVLARGVDVLAATTTDLYLLTHAAMYLSDVGRRPVSAPPSVALSVAHAEAALAIALDDDNLDLATEVLWLWPMLGLPATPVMAVGHAVVEAAILDLGFVPGPGHDLAVRAAMEPDEAHWYDLRTSYHATLVFGILCAARLRHPAQDWCVPAAPVAARTGTTAASARRWEVAIAALPVPDRAGPASLATTAAVRRAARSGDLDALQTALRDALALDDPDIPAVAQGAGVLRRATLVARRGSPAGRPHGVGGRTSSATSAWMTCPKLCSMPG